MKNLIQKNRYIVDISADSFAIQETGVAALFDENVLNYNSSNVSLEVFLTNIIKKDFDSFSSILEDVFKKNGLPNQNLSFESLSLLALDELYFVACHTKVLFMALVGVKVNDKNETVTVGHPKGFDDERFDHVGLIYTFEKVPVIAFSKIYKFECQLHSYYNNGNFELIVRDPNGYTLSDKIYSKSVVGVLNVDDALYRSYRRFA